MSNNKNHQAINAETIDRWIEEGREWGRPIDHETYKKALCGEWYVLLTPTKPVPHAQGKKLLGIACGGGQLETGFTLTSLYEDTNGEGRLHELGIPTFLAMRSVKERK